MHVSLLAYPRIVSRAAEDIGYRFHDDSPSNAEDLVEVAGRQCYESWDRPNAATASTAGYMANIIGQAHFSIMEHAQFSFVVQEVSRALLAELTRHRHLSFSVRSQRYVNEEHGSFVLPPELGNLAALGLNPDEITAIEHEFLDHHQAALDLYVKLHDTLKNAGIPHKRARQAARYVLPVGHATGMVVSGNIRAWREVIAKRSSFKMDTGEPYADLEINRLARRILEILYQHAPSTVADLWEQHEQWKRTPYGIAQGQRERRASLIG